MDILGLIPSFGGVLFTIVAFVVALSIIVAIHEYGHYIVGRWSGIHAEVFSIGFGPTLLSRTDKRGTRWQVAALPFGGYVKFLGDADAASGKDGEAIGALSPEARRHTMHGAPLWARAATVAAGPGFNFISAILIFAAFFLLQGVATDTPVVGTLKPLPAYGETLRPGDAILSVAGIATPDNDTFYAAVGALPAAATVAYRIRRDGAEAEVIGPFPFPPIVDALQPGSPGYDGGLLVGDIIETVDGTAIFAFSELRTLVAASEGNPMQLGIWRDGARLKLTLAPRRMDIPTADGGFETRWLIGLTGGLFYTPDTRSATLTEAISGAAWQTWAIVRTSVSALGHMVTGAISTCTMSGPLGIAEASGQAAGDGPVSFLWFIAVLSTAVGLMNLFPIPVLDGGHLVFHAYEAIFRRPPNERALRALMNIGLLLLLGLMIFALTNDVFCP